ncbi:MAG TPA: helix-turn-helix domain-containing protein [Ktedonobacteraceae bacterium]|nr:helix-turn-helix domain-containing protein [Ktedonobacteraceae bacterium]
MMNEGTSAEQMLSASQAGKVLGVSGKTVIRMMEDGDFPGYKIGSAWKFKRGDIESYIESRKFQGRKAESTDPHAA